tara:strand:- start:22371 stop:22868 length:498 start_codon:yes stop_codon:yes gene_type:complete
VQHLDLQGKASQTLFAQLVGVSQQVIALKVKDGILPRDGTYAEWLALYCDRLRNEAAGRAGEAQNRLTEARIAEAQESTAEKKQRRLKDAKQLLQRADVEVLILELPRITRQQIMTTGELIQEALEAKHGLELTDDDIQEPLRSALGRIADHAGKLAESICGDPE